MKNLRKTRTALSFLLILALLMGILPMPLTGLDSPTAVANSTNGAVLLEPKYTAQQIMNFFEHGFYGDGEGEDGGILSRPDLVANFLGGETGDISAKLSRAYYGGKVGLVDPTGRVVMPAIYDDIQFLYGGWIRVSINGESEYINTFDEADLYPAEYKYIGEFSENLAPVLSGEVWGIIDSYGTIVVPFDLDYDLIAAFSEGLAAVHNGIRWGYIDTTGNVVIPVDLEYDWVEGFSNGLAVVQKEDKFGIINTSGAEVVPVEYDEVRIGNGDLIAVRLGNKWGYYNTSGAIVVNPAVYDDARIEYCLIAVQIGNKWGYINHSGAEVVPAIYDDVMAGDNGLIRVRSGDKWGYLNTAGETVVPVEYDDAWIGDDGLIRVWTGDWHTGTRGYYNAAGEVVVSPTAFDDVAEIDRFNLIRVRTGDWETGKYGFLDISGEVVVSGEYDIIGEFSDGLAVVRKNDNWGYINTSGSVAIAVDLEYDVVGAFSEGLATVQSDGRWGYIYTSGDVAIPVNFKFDFAGNFSSGLAAVQRDGKWGFIDTSGIVVIPLSLEYDSVETFCGCLLSVQKDGKLGLINISGEIVVPANYHGIHTLSNGYAWIMGEDNLYGIVQLTCEGRKDLTPFWGDANGDGVINAADTTAIRRYIAASDKETFFAENTWFNLANANVLGRFDEYGDPIIDSADVTRLRQFLAATDPATVPLGPVSIMPFANTLTVTPSTNWTPGSAQSSRAVGVSSNITWTVSSNDTSWLTISDIMPPNRTGSGTFTMNARANTMALTRSATVTISGGGITRRIEVTQAAAAATLTVSPMTWNPAVSGGNTTISVTSNANWGRSSATALPSWLTMTNITPAEQLGNGSFRLNATANTTTSQRTASVTITTGGINRTISVTQPAAGASLTLSPTTWSAAVSGGNTSVTVTSNVAWNAPTSDQTWLTFTNVPTNRNSGGTFTMNAAANTTTGSRSATVTVTGGGLSRTISVTQAAAAATLTVSPTSWNPNSTAQNTSITVTSNTSWSAWSSDPTWLGISKTSGSGNDTLTMNVLANPNITTRTGTITISSGGITRTINVTQAAAGANLTISSTTWNPSATAQTSGNFTVTSNVSWSAWSDSPTWLGHPSVTSGNSGTTTFTINVLANPNTTSRSGKIIISSASITREITVTQAAAAASLTLSPTSWNPAATTQSTSVTVTSNITWNVPTSDHTWLTFTNVPANRNGSGTFTMNAAANTTTNSRSATVTVTGGSISRTISVTQAAAAATLTVSSTSWNPGSAAQTSGNITVTSNTSWTVSSNRDWLTTSRAGGSNTFTMRAATNTATSSRSATVTVTGGGISRTISVTQAAAARTYTVTYNANGGTGAPSSLTRNVGQTATISNTRPTRTGYFFFGWQVQFTSIEFQPGATYTDNRDLPLVAIWVATKTVSAADHFIMWIATSSDGTYPVNLFFRYSETYAVRGARFASNGPRLYREIGNIPHGANPIIGLSDVKYYSDIGQQYYSSKLHGDGKSYLTNSGWFGRGYEGNPYVLASKPNHGKAELMGSDTGGGHPMNLLYTKTLTNYFS
jgi:hypothetical protein